MKKALKDELKDCTFEPIIDEPRHGRCFSNFLQDQRSHSLKREEMLSHLFADKEQKVSKQLYDAPKISEV